MVCKLPNAKHFSLSARKTILIQSRTVIVMHCRWSVCQNWWSSMYFSKYECWVLERFREQAEIKYSWLYLPKGNEKTQNWNDVILELARCLGNNKLHILLTHVQPGRIKLISNKYQRRPGPLLLPLIPSMSVVLVTASADQELDSKAISENV